MGRPSRTVSNTPWEKIVLWAAAAHCIMGGILMVIIPRLCLRLSGLEAGESSELLLAAVGIFVMVQGLGYYMASRHIENQWLVISLGLLLKTLFFIGTLNCYLLGKTGLSFLFMSILNEFIWIFPLAAILWNIFRHKKYQ